MKKTILITSLLFICAATSILFYACKKNQTANVSKVDHKILADVDQDITRSELAALEIHEQLQIFNELTSANKLRIYHEKLDLILNTETLTTAEEEHLEDLYTILDVSMYGDEGENEELPQVLSNWLDYAINSLGWDNEKIYWYIETWSTPTEAENRPIGTGGGGPVEPAVACVCRYDIACGLFGDCRAQGCSVTNDGCGFAGTSKCKGDCF